MPLTVALWAVAGFVLGTLLEYWVHRAMHWGWLFSKRHREHHRDGWGQGFWPELRTYVLPSIPVLVPPYLIDVRSGVAWTTGCVGFAVFASYAHQLQHDSPAACRWMSMPVHYVHHRDQMWRHNFGMAVDWWDRLFGTYRTESCDELRDERTRPLEIGWWEPLHAEGVWRNRPGSL